jgi:addiction module RelE/StbE family toxin
VRWSGQAQRDLDDIVDFIAQDSEINAEAVLDRLHEQALSLDLLAERGRRIPELAGGPRSRRTNWRELLVRPWRIVYAIEGESVLVLAVVDGRRDFRAWLAGRPGG